MKPACKNCCYFNSSEMELGQGVCMRYPPREVPIEIDSPLGKRKGFASRFPAVKPDAWCGEFKRGIKNETEH